MYNSKLGRSEPKQAVQLLCRLLWEAARLGDLQVMSTACLVWCGHSLVQALIRSIHFVQSKRVKEATEPASTCPCPKDHLALFLDWKNSQYHNRTPLHGQFLHDSFLHCFA